MIMTNLSSWNQSQIKELVVAGASTVTQLLSGPKAYFRTKTPLFVYLLRATELPQ